MNHRATTGSHRQAHPEGGRRVRISGRGGALVAVLAALLATSAFAGGAPPAPVPVPSSDARRVLERIAARYLRPQPHAVELEITAVIFGHTRRATGQVVFTPPAPGEDSEGGTARVAIDGQASSVHREREGVTSRVGGRAPWREIAPEHRTPVRSPILLALRGLDARRVVLVGRKKGSEGAAGQVVLEAPLRDPRPPFRSARVRALEPSYALVSLELLDEHGEALLSARVVRAGAAAAATPTAKKERVR